MSTDNTITIDNWAQPTELSPADFFFGGSTEILLPPYDSIPEEFRLGRSPWNAVVSRWFFSGLPQGTVFLPKTGIDEAHALRHLKTILRSWTPKREHKEAGVAYLLSRWFTEVVIPEGGTQS